MTLSKDNLNVGAYKKVISFIFYFRRNNNVVKLPDKRVIDNAKK